MSHFIQDTKYLQNPPIFSLPPKQVVMPRIKKFIKNDKINDENSQHHKRYVRTSSRMLNDLCIKLQQTQFHTLHQQNAHQMQSKFKKLKSKLYTNMQKQSVQKIFTTNNENDKLNIKEILKMRPEKVQIQKKYSNKIFLKLQTIKQADEINRMKQKYNHWYDNVKNDRKNSPILKKVNYLLERAHKQNILTELNIKSPLVRKTHNNTLKELNLGTFNTTFNRTIDGSMQQNHSPYMRRKQKWGQYNQQHEKFSIY